MIATSVALEIWKKKKKKKQKRKGKSTEFVCVHVWKCVNAHLALRFTQIAQCPCVTHDESTLVIVSTKSQLVHLALTHSGDL